MELNFFLSASVAVLHCSRYRVALQAAAEASKPILGLLKIIEHRDADISKVYQYLVLKPLISAGNLSLDK